MSVLETARRILPYYEFYVIGGNLDNNRCFLKAVIDFEDAYKLKVDSTTYCEVHGIFNQ